MVYSDSSTVQHRTINAVGLTDLGGCPMFRIQPLHQPNLKPGLALLLFVLVFYFLGLCFGSRPNVWNRHWGFLAGLGGPLLDLRGRHLNMQTKKINAPLGVWAEYLIPQKLHLL